MSYMSQLAALAEEGGLEGASVEEVIESARDIIEGDDEDDEWIDWATTVLALVSHNQLTARRSSYQPCGCRDCMDITIGDGSPTLCAECEDAGCDVDGGDCQVVTFDGFEPEEYDPDKYYGT